MDYKWRPPRKASSQEIQSLKTDEVIDISSSDEERDKVDWAWSVICPHCGADIYYWSDDDDEYDDAFAHESVKMAESLFSDPSQYF